MRDLCEVEIEIYSNDKSSLFKLYSSLKTELFGTASSDMALHISEHRKLLEPQLNFDTCCPDGIWLLAYIEDDFDPMDMENLVQYLHKLNPDPIRIIVEYAHTLYKLFGRYTYENGGIINKYIPSYFPIWNASEAESKRLEDLIFTNGFYNKLVEELEAAGIEEHWKCEDDNVWKQRVLK